MKRIITVLVCFTMFLCFMGCSGSPKFTIYLESISSSTTGNAAKYIQDGNPLDPDGKDGKFNATTSYILPDGITVYRTLCLQAVIKDEQGNIIYPDRVDFTHDFPASDISRQQERILDINPSNPGVYNVTASYQGYSCQNTVVVLKKVIMGNTGDNTGALKLSTYDQTSTSPDISFVYNTDRSYDLTAPNGIAVVQVFDSTYLDVVPRQAICDVSEVPSNLTYVTSLTIPEDKSYILIAKDASGGYAKILFSQGNNVAGSGGEGFPGIYMEYIASGTEFQWHF